jgi:hypothetical protein
LAEALSTSLSDRSRLKKLGQAGATSVRSFSLECSLKELGALYERQLDRECSPQLVPASTTHRLQDV